MNIRVSATFPLVDERATRDEAISTSSPARVGQKQDVFFREGDGGARPVRSPHRFDTARRSLVLSNDGVAAGGSVPAFTNATLREAIGRVGQKMNPNEDVLFLYLTSHGSQAGLAIERRHPRADGSARRMLDDAGIRWRVIVIAGCESGVFVDALESESTLVATAAAEDRPSYGCASGRAYTDYGAALLQEEGKLPLRDVLRVGAPRARRAT